MPSASFIGDAFSGTTSDSQYCVESYECNCTTDAITGETVCDTCYRYSSADISGTVSSGSSNVFINNKNATFVTSSTDENASCPTGYSGSTSGIGTVVSGSGSVFVNGNKVSRIGDSVDTHSGDTATISSGGSANVIVA